MSFDAQQLTDAIGERGPVVRVVVLSTRGSVPREAGTAMLVWAQGQRGTIGGGALEYAATTEARKMLLNRVPSTMETKPLGPALAQCCGGSVTLLYERFDQVELPEHATVSGLYVRAVTKTAAPETPPDLLRRARNGISAPLLFEGWVAEAINRTSAPVWIFGAGHVGRAVAATLAPLPDFNVTLIDTSADRLPDPVPTGVAPLIAANPVQLIKHAPDNAHHLIMTFSHTLDLDLCHALLTHPFASLGLIGSDTKWVRFRKRLTTLGHSSAQIDRITCPIGDPTLGKHPQEIAIGVAQALLHTYRQTAHQQEIAS